MKTAITRDYLENAIGDILEEKEKQADSAKLPFDGVRQADLVQELNQRIGTADWVIKKEQPFKFTKRDIDAIANSRFYRKSGMKILMLWAIAILVLLQAIVWFPFLPIYIYYAMLCVATVGFVGLYNKKQRESRRELWKGIRGDGIGGEQEK